MTAEERTARTAVTSWAVSLCRAYCGGPLSTYEAYVARFSAEWHALPYALRRAFDAGYHATFRAEWERLETVP